MKVNISKIKQNIINQISRDLKKLNRKWIKPRLDVILIWEDADAENYANIKKKLWVSLWFDVNIDKFSKGEIDNSKLEDLILKKNADQNIHWIILESPVLSNIDYFKAIEKIIFFKDVDGVSSKNLWFLRNFQEEKWIMPATPLSCIKILDSIFDTLKGKKICLIWDGKTVGRALGRMLLNRWATLTVCNIDTKDIKQFTLNSEIVICAAWQVNLLTQDMVNKNSVIIDVGTNRTSDWLVWDADYANIQGKVKYISPVPWWVGTITTVTLLQNVIKAYKLCAEYDHFSFNLNDFEKILGSSELPWWGSLTALTTIHWANLLNMVCNLTKENPEIIENLKSQINIITPKLKEIYNMDMQIFNEFLAAIKLPKDTEEEKYTRQQKIQESLQRSCELLIKLINKNIKLIKIGKKIFDIGNKSAISDVLVAQNLFEANIKSCSDLMVWNSIFIKDKTFLEKIQKYLNY